MKWLIAVAILAVAQASCPNSCSGHGTCNNYDQCTCFDESSLDNSDSSAEWTGADCSLRTCPRGTSWTTPGDDASASCGHAEDIECSDQGLCDRSTGLCTCFDGYTGSACQRTECPNDCSGHGTCRSNRDFAYDWAVSKTNQLDGTSGDINSFEEGYFASYENAWDSGMHFGCLCDEGFRGADCSLIECPSFIDPMDDKCNSTTLDDFDQNDIVNYQIQLDTAVGSSAWETAYAEGTAGSNENPYIIDNVLYACFGSMSGQDCSGRGICDYSTGSCECFSGYGGTACETVSELV